MDRHVSGYGSRIPHLLLMGQSCSKPGHPAGFNTLSNPEPPARLSPVHIQTEKVIYSLKMAFSVTKI